MESRGGDGAREARGEWRGEERGEERGVRAREERERLGMGRLGREETVGRRTGRQAFEGGSSAERMAVGGMKTGLWTGGFWFLRIVGEGGGGWGG